MSKLSVQSEHRVGTSYVSKIYVLLKILAYEICSYRVHLQEKSFSSLQTPQKAKGYPLQCLDY